jgi:glycogen operon protein
MIATLLLSQGVPMLLHGDEMSRTQDGNNNTYAQDSEISWVHWDRADKPLIEFTSAVANLRKSHPTFRRKRFFTGSTVRTGDPVSGGERLNDIVWLALNGQPMEDRDWANGSQAIGMYLNGDGIAGKDARGQTITDDHFLLYFNADGDAEVTLPTDEYAAAWDVVIDTGGSADDARTYEAGATFPLGTRSLVVLREHAEPEAQPDHSVAASVAALSGQNSAAGSPAADQRKAKESEAKSDKRKKAAKTAKAPKADKG